MAAAPATQAQVEVLTAQIVTLQGQIAALQQRLSRDEGTIQSLRNQLAAIQTGKR